ncbi:MAG: GNAT family N-acetyltransferase [Thermoplasmata archaeon]
MTSKSPDVLVRQMTTDDAPRILELINIEGWSYHLSEIERMLKLSPGSSIVACTAGGIIGGITAFTMDDRCVLGHVVIESKWRKKGIGSILINALISNEEKKGIDIFDVFSVKEAVPFYKRHGFRSVETLDTYARVLTASDREPVSDNKVRRLTDADISQLAELDESVSGFCRKALLECLMRDFPENSLGLFDRGELKGFLLARTNEIMSDIGPWIMSSPDEIDAEILFKAVLGKLPIGRKAILGVPETNSTAKKILERHGFAIEFHNYRLVRSKSAVSPFSPGIFSISGFELG